MVQWVSVCNFIFSVGGVMREDGRASGRAGSDMACSLCHRWRRMDQLRTDFLYNGGFASQLTLSGHSSSCKHQRPCKDRAAPRSSPRGICVLRAFSCASVRAIYGAPVLSAAHAGVVRASYLASLCTRSCSRTFATTPSCTGRSSRCCRTMSRRHRCTAGWCHRMPPRPRGKRTWTLPSGRCSA